MVTTYEITDMNEGPTHYYHNIEETLEQLRIMLENKKGSFEISLVGQNTVDEE